MENKFLKLGVGLLISILFLGVIIYADSNGVWHRADDVRVGTFGIDEGDSASYYVFNNPVRFNSVVQASTDVAITGELKVNTIRPNSNGNVVIVLG